MWMAGSGVFINNNAGSSFDRNPVADLCHGIPEMSLPYGWV